MSSIKQWTPTDITLVNVSDGWKEVVATVHFRHYHTAAVTPSGLLLVGGYRVGGLGGIVLLLGSGYVQGYRVGGVVLGTGVQGGQTLVTVWVQS